MGSPTIPGRHAAITDDDVEAPVVKTLEETPTDAAHWSTRSTAKATGMSQSAVSRIWRAFGLNVLAHVRDTASLRHRRRHDTCHRSHGAAPAPGKAERLGARLDSPHFVQA